MTSRDVGVLSCKILSIYVIVIVLSQLNGLLMHYSSLLAVIRSSSDSPTEMNIAWFLGSAAGMLILSGFCAFLWLGAGYLARRMVPDSEEKALGTALSARDFQVIAFSVVGLLLVVKALPDAASTAWRYAQLPDSPGGWLRAELPMHLIRLGLQFVIGLGLFFGARGLVGMWRKLHGLGWEAGRDEGAKD